MRTRLIALVAVLVLVIAACSSDSGDTTTTADSGGETTTTADSGGETTTTADSGGETTTTAGSGSGLEDYGESTDADPALVDKALGVSVAETPEIVLASIARASIDLTDEQIATAMVCWAEPECDTGTGGELTMGYADGGGLNVWRQVTHMEAILQALTYPDIGRIISTDAQWNTDPNVAAGDIRFLIQAGVDFMIGYPDQGIAIADAILEAEAAGIPYIPYSAGYVGLPGQDGALVPGEDYTSIVGEDLCQLGDSFAEIMNTEVGEGTIGILGGTPGNALSLGWQTCEIDALNDSIDVLGPADTYWVNSIALETVTGWLATDPDIAGYSYEYADGLYTALDAYEQLGIPVENLTVTVRTDEQTLFCDWADRGEDSYKIWYSAGGNFQSRVAVTASMLYLQGYELPAEILVPAIMREVTADDCNADRVTETVSNTSLVPDEILILMYAS